MLRADCSEDLLHGLDLKVQLAQVDETPRIDFFLRAHTVAGCQVAQVQFGTLPELAFHVSFVAVDLKLKQGGRARRAFHVQSLHSYQAVALAEPQHVEAFPLVVHQVLVQTIKYVTLPAWRTRILQRARQLELRLARQVWCVLF